MRWKTLTAITLIASLIGGYFYFSPSEDFALLTDEQEMLGAANQATVELLGGGGGGGVIANSGGGGGGGGEFRAATCTLAVASYTVTVATGGLADNSGDSDSVFSGGGALIIADGGNGSTGAGAGTPGNVAGGGGVTGCTSIVQYDGGTPGAGNGTSDAGGGGGGGAGWGGKGGNGTAANTTLGGGGGGGAGESAAGGNAGTAPNAGTGGTGGGGGGGAGGNGAVGAGGTAGTPATYHIVGGGGGGGGDDGLRGGACGAPGAGSGGGEVTGAGNGCRGEVRITYIDDQINATGGTETTSGIYRTHTFTSSGTFTVSATATSPYVVLNSPANASTTSDTTPDLTFTGTASSSDPIRYNVQVDSVNTFDSQIVSPATIDSFTAISEIAAQTLGNNTIGYVRVGQSFTGNGTTLGTAKFKLTKIGSPTGNVSAVIYAHSGTYGVSSVGSGSALATSGTIDVSTISTSETEYTFTFSGANQIALSNGTNYVIMLEYGAGTTGDYLNVRHDYNGGIHGGQQVLYDTAWVSNSADTEFNVLDLGSSGPLLSKISGTDPGFSGTPDNTDPFASAQQVTYTVQSALSDNTYYWRVRGIDPDGTNAYGNWSETRSFTVSSGGGGGGSTPAYIEDVYLLQ